MFSNLSLKGFNWTREPILILTAIVAIGQVLIQILSGDLNLEDGIAALVVLVGGVVARGRVSPAV